MESKKNGIEGIRILSLEDNVIDSEIMNMLLADTGIELDVVSTAREAYDMIKEHSYDVLLIDHMMPGVDGITVLKTIREQHLCDNTPAIAVTGNNISSAKNNYLEAGFSEYVTKPVDKEKLIAAITSCLGNTAESKQDIEKHTVLIVDDNQMNLLLARKILMEQYNVSVVSSAKSALAFLEEEIPDMILLDLLMPEMDGFEFLEIVKKDDRYKDIPIICLTADDDRESELKCFELGALDFITKPFMAEIMRR